MKPIYLYETKSFFCREDPICVVNADEKDISKMQLHRHTFAEICYISYGEGKHFVDGREYYAAKGDLFLIDCDKVHGFTKFDENKSLKTVNVMFIPEILNEDFNEIIGDKFDFSKLLKSLMPAENFSKSIFSVHASQNLIEILEKLSLEYRDKAPGRAQIMHSLLVQLLIGFMREIRKTHGKELQVEIYGKSSEEIFRAISFIKANYDKKISLELLSKETCFSKPYLCTIFKKSTNLSIGEYWQKVRIEKACELLKGTDCSVADIWQKVGFCDYKTFIKLFKKYTATVPSHYKRINV